jgi:tRNA dimethylallyltransferase
MGQTASGKTALAEGLAERFDAQLINADAFQAYRGMDVGTAKPSDRERYRLLDIKAPNETYGVGEFCVRAAEVLNELYGQGRSAIVVGGTGQYVRALFEEYRDLMPEPDVALREAIGRRLREEGLPALVDELTRRDPALAARTELQNPVRVTRALERLTDSRPPLAFRVPYAKRIKVATVAEKDDGDSRIALRTATMMHNGWVDEVRRLLAEGYGPEDPGFRAIGYRKIASLVDGDLATEEAERAIVQETVSYAKRQRTWLRSEPGLRIFVTDGTYGLQETVESIHHESLGI